MKIRDVLLAAAYRVEEGGSATDYLATVDSIFDTFPYDSYSPDKWRTIGDAIDRLATAGESRVDTLMRLVNTGLPASEVGQE